MDKEIIVFDRADYQIGAIEYFDLPEKQLYVILGFYFCWLVLNDLVIKSKFTDSNLIKLMDRVYSPGEAFNLMTGGVLESRYMKTKAIEFTLYYHNPDKNYYDDDYESILLKKLPSFNHVDDSWRNYELISPTIQSRYSAWDWISSK